MIPSFITLNRWLSVSLLCCGLSVPVQWFNLQTAQAATPAALVDKTSFAKPVLSGSEYHALAQASVWMKQDTPDAFKQALPLLEQAVEQNPTNMVALFNLGDCALKLAETTPDTIQQAAYYNLAEKSFLRLQTLSPSMGTVYFKLGKIAVFQKRFEAARAYYQQGVEQADNKGLLWFNLAWVCEQLNQSEEAMNAYRQAIQADKNLLYAYNNLGLMLEQAGKTNEAMGLYRQALTQNDRYVFARLNLGSLLAKQGNLAEAERQFLRALEIDPKNAWGKVYLGNVYFQQNKLQQAISLYESATQDDPGFANAYYLMALAYNKLNRPDDAVSAGLHYIALDPNGDYSVEMKRLIVFLSLQKSGGITLRLNQAKEGSP